MSVRIETLGMRTRNPQAALLVLVAGLVAFVAVLTLLRVAPDTKAPVRPPAVATTVSSAPGAAIKAVANDPYLRLRPSQSSTRVAGVEATKASLQEPGFGPNFNMGRACPKCW
jgi:NaMN:DMB phosphoribosyltransferase